MSEIRNDEIMHYFYIGVVGLVQLELKATRRENGCNSEVKLAVCQTNGSRSISHRDAKSEIHGLRLDVLDTKTLTMPSAEWNEILL